MTGPVIDLFAGPGGWDLAAHALGLRPLGIEWDDAACATREAAGLWTLQGDIGALDPHQVAAEHFPDAWAAATPDRGPLWGLIASPPCQAFSMAGKGAGRAAIDDYRGAIALMAAGEDVDWEAIGEACEDERAHLVLEPLRWALALGPRWIACEQVEPVLPLWEAMASELRHHGYSTWTGVLSAERYGVPQTRRRAILIASLDRQVDEPPATHQRYIAPRRRDEQTIGLFDAPEPERIVLPEEAHLLPWVSMAEALGWGEGDLVGFPRLADTPANRTAGTVTLDGTDYRERDLREAREPSFVLTEKARSWQRWALRAGTNANDAERGALEPAPTLRFGARLNTVTWVSNAQPNATVRRADEPAPTIKGGHDHGDRRWIAYDSRGQRDGRTGKPNRRRSVDEPAPTIAGESRNDGWVRDRPATTVAGDPRVHPPGHKVNADDVAAGRDRYDGRAGENAIRVSEAEAAVLQSFPANYPWQGTKSKRFEQIGNAVPPLLAWHVLQAVADLPAAEPEPVVLDDPLAREIAEAEDAYEAALRHPRCEGLEAAGARLHRLYHRQRAARERVDAAA